MYLIMMHTSTNVKSFYINLLVQEVIIRIKIKVLLEIQYRMEPIYQKYTRIITRIQLKKILSDVFLDRRGKKRGKFTMQRVLINKGYFIFNL